MRRPRRVARSVPGARRLLARAARRLPSPPGLGSSDWLTGRGEGGYDLASLPATLLREEAVRALAAQPGEVILDVGCGTGLNFRAVQQAIGPTGQLIGVEPSAEMLHGARERIRRHGWRNVTLLHGGAESFAVDVRADAALLCLVHDVVRSEAALDRVFAHLRPEGRVVAAGAKWTSRWLPAVNASVWLLNRPYVSSFEGFGSPWDCLALRCELRVEVLDAYAGGAYVARGRLRQ